MNQILSTNLNKSKSKKTFNNSKDNNQIMGIIDAYPSVTRFATSPPPNIHTNISNNFTKRFFKLQFSLSILAILIIIGIAGFSYYNIKSKEKLSSQLINNYNIARLYSNNSSLNENKEIMNNNLFGIIEIPKINIYYPIFSNLTDELLKISPCKFYGDSLNQPGNICIAGHNYNNSLFFGNLNALSIYDTIYIYDNYGKKYTFTITNLYEVNSSDLSPIFDFDNNLKNLTLVTCTNFNSKRFIVKAVQNKI